MTTRAALRHRLFLVKMSFPTRAIKYVTDSRVPIAIDCQFAIGIKRMGNSNVIAINPNSEIAFLLITYLVGLPVIKAKMH